MTTLRYTEADFDKIKENLKNWLKTQTKFSDYNFDGSAISILLDVLAGNTAYSAFYLNMIFAEGFLDSATKRSSVVGLAKHLGYVPRSARSAIAKVTITVDPTLGPGDVSPASILIPITQEFSTSINNKVYYFSPVSPVLITPNAGGSYTKTEIPLIEGKRLSYQWKVDNGSPTKQRYIIPNIGIDTTQLVVKVKTSETSSAIKIYQLSDDITEVTSTSYSYFLQEADDGKYEIYFGDGNVGVALENGNVVIAEYLISSGDIVTGAKTFTPVTKIGGYNSSSIVCTTPAQDSEQQESIESIKLLAPLNYEAQNRAVTKGDYETLIKKEVPGIQYVRVWGGEESEPPDYGKVYIALKPDTGLALSEDQKAAIIRDYIQPRNMVSIEAKIVEPEYLFVKLTTNVLYDSSLTSIGIADLESLIISKILTFADTELNGFDSDLRYSHLTRSIDETDASIQGNLTKLTLKYRITPPFDVPTKYVIKINNSISRGDALNNNTAITSSAFVYRGITTYIGDDGLGKLYLYRLVNNVRIIIQENIGTVDYVTGEIILLSLEVQSIPNNLSYIDILITPEKNDVIALRQQIILIEEPDISVIIEDIKKRV